MVLSVHFNGTSVRTHRTLVSAERSLGVALERLSSGTRLRTAGDDPSAMVLANQLRYAISGLTRAAANAEEGVSMLQTADGAMDEISALLQRARTLAVQAANEGVTDPASLQAMQTELDTTIASITRIAGSSRFGSLPLLDGSLGGNRLSAAAGEVIDAIAYESSLTAGGVLPGSRISVIMPPLGLTLDRDRAQAALTVAALPADRDVALSATDQYSGLTYPRTLALTGPGGSYALTVTAATTISDLAAQIEAVRTTYGVQAGYDDASGMLTVEATRFGAAGLSVQDTTAGGGAGILDSAATSAANALLVPGTNQTVDITYTDAAGSLRTVTLTQDPAIDGGRSFVNLLGGPELAPPFTAFDPGAFRLTFSDTTAGVRGADILVPFSADYYGERISGVAIQMGDQASQRVTVDIPDLRAGALGRTAGLVTDGLGTLQALVNAGALITGKAAEAIRVIDASIAEVSDVRGRIGAVQSNAVEAGLSSLRVGLENLATAQSQLRDTDFAAEAAVLARQQILVQAATAMLAQANQTPRTIVDLLQSR